MGSWVSKLQGTADPAIPAHLSLMYKTGEQRWGYPGSGGFLGLTHAPFQLTGGSDTNLKADGMVLKDMTLDQLGDRVSLLKAFDGLDRAIDNTGTMNGMDGFTQQAVGILTSSRLVDALDLSKEDPEVVARYGVNDPVFERDGAPRMVRNFCVARRLVEAGARVVTLNFSRWDWHGPDGKNFVQGRKDMPLLDKALAALIEDIHDRGLDKDVSVVVWGEFGRTPKINKDASRDHWPQANSCLLAGGGMKTGQVIGSTNRYGEVPKDRPIKVQDVFATLYTNLGLKLNQITVFDPNGRPQYLVDPEVEPIRELI
jgi:hypothetical protein